MLMTETGQCSEQQTTNPLSNEMIFFGFVFNIFLDFRFDLHLNDWIISIRAINKFLFLFIILHLG